VLLAPAFLAGAALGLAHVPLGAEVLRRGIIFLDLAIAQAAALGMVGFVVLAPPDLPWADMGAAAAGLACAMACAGVLHTLERRAGARQEALIGAAFVVCASLVAVALSGDPHADARAADILAGQILWTTWADLALIAPLCAAVAALWAWAPVVRGRGFYALFALTIPFSVQVAGVYLVFASLVLPALATAGLARHRPQVAYALSVAGFAGGLALSYAADLPAGPAIVLALCAASIAVARSACCAQK